MNDISDRARQLHSESVVIDACSFFCKGYGENIELSGVTALALTTPWPWDGFDVAVQRTEDYYQLARQDTRFRLVNTVDDIRLAKESNQIGILLFAQGPSPISDRLTRVETMVRLGYRIMQLTYSERNLVGDGCNETSDVGLSQFGFDLIQEMNDQGMVIDLSHAGKRTALEATSASEKPVIVSHTNVFARYPNPRNISDELIKAVAEGGGVIGLTTYAPLNWDGDLSRSPTLDDYLDTIEYVNQLVGVDHIGIGTDSEATPNAYPLELRHELAQRYPRLTSGYFGTFGADAPRQVVGFSGMRDLPKITAGLLQRGYSDDGIKKILGENFLRVYAAVWQR